jgi:hypothetical protein
MQSSLLMPYIVQIDENVLLFGRVPEWAIIINFSPLPPPVAAQVYMAGEVFARSQRMLERCISGEAEDAVQHFEIAVEAESRVVAMTEEYNEPE